jgi:hypothetical protein
MQFDKQQVLDLLRTRGQPGDPDETERARRELPDPVETDDVHHRELLTRLGIDPRDLVSKLAGGRFGL